MTRSRFPLLTACLLALAAPAIAAYGLALRARDAVVIAFSELFRPEPTRFAAAGFDMPLELSGYELPRDVQQALRHEAGVPRVSAARNT